MFKMSKDFFSLSIEEKSKYCCEDKNGYLKTGVELLSPNLLDFKETMNFKTDISKMEIIPPLFENNKVILEDFLAKLSSLTRVILIGLALCLEIDPYFFIKAHDVKNASRSILRLSHYPPLQRDMKPEHTTRIGSHSDYGTVTVLFQEAPENVIEAASGLQTQRKEKDSDGNIIWDDIPSKKGCVVINVADVLSFWSEGRLRSAVHRVILPEGDRAYKPRYSIVYFVHPDAGYPIHPISSKIPAPFPALKTDTGALKTSFGQSEFYYGESGDVYLKRRLESTLE